MHPRALAIVLALLSMGITVSAFGAEPAVGVGYHTGGGLIGPPMEGGGLAGLGGLGSLGGVGSSVAGGAIVVPLNVSRGFRVEPALSLAYEQSKSVVGSDSTERASTAFGLSLGTFYCPWLSPKTRLQAGPRLGLARSAHETTFGSETTSTSRMSYALAAVMGAEFYLAPRFSLGAEVSLSGSYSGDISTSGGDSSVADSTDAALSIASGGALRFVWYLL